MSTRRAANSTGIAGDEGKANEFRMSPFQCVKSNLIPPARICKLSLDFRVRRISIELSPPIQFRIEWAASQGMSPLLGCRPI
jgi:hypothetical protein